MDNLYPCFDEMLVLAHNGFLFWNLYRARPPLPNDSNSIVSRNSHTYQITGENCACTSKPCCLRRGVADPVLMRSAMVVVGESGERGLGFPSHVGVGVAKTVFQHLDHTITGHVQVRTGVAAVWQMVGCEGVREGGVDAFGGEDGQQLAQAGGLLGLVTDVVAVQPDRGGVVVFDDHPGTSALVGRALEGGTPELGDRAGLSLRDAGTDGIAVAVGDRDRPIGVDRDEVEQRPVDALERY